MKVTIREAVPLAVVACLLGWFLAGLARLLGVIP